MAREFCPKTSRLFFQHFTDVPNSILRHQIFRARGFFVRRGSGQSVLLERLTQREETNVSRSTRVSEISPGG